ncbi:MAG: hypothetical protein Q8M92_00095 [Candidatus Subteraquimicrobiales bacterium]|nr:hypothetical protein [Candidatus Subteraquimicrobiales bacterium]
MCKSVKVILSTDEKDNEVFEELMKKLEGVKISRTRDGQKLFDISELPYIYTNEGDRYFGAKGVKAFVERELSRKIT